VSGWEVAVAVLAALSLSGGALGACSIIRHPSPDPVMDNRIEGAAALFLLGVVLVALGALLWG
jgi:hypothetical protein